MSVVFAAVPHRNLQVATLRLAGSAKAAIAATFGGLHTALGHPPSKALTGHLIGRKLRLFAVVDIRALRVRSAQLPSLVARFPNRTTTPRGTSVVRQPREV